MNVERLVTERQEAWRSLDALMDRAGRKPDKLPPGDLLVLGRAYRAAVADLAVARRSCAPSDPVLLRLEDRVRRARGLVYDAEPKRSGIISFFARDYWRRVRERPVLMVASGAALLVPAALGIVWSFTDPSGARSFLPAMFSGPIEAREASGLPAEAAAAVSSAIFVNNIRVTLLAFALGITCGLGTVFVLLNNGVLLGVLGGLFFEAGAGAFFVELVAPHGALELTCIVVSGAAGLRLGWAIVDPGPGPRGDAVIAEARGGVEIVLGTAPWLVAAGLVEGFVTPRQVGLGAALAVGIGLAAVWWALLWWRGGRSG